MSLDEGGFVPAGDYEFRQDITITVLDVVEPPVLTLGSDSLTFQENQVNTSVQPIASGATVTLREKSWAGGQLSVKGLLGEDAVVIRNDGLGAGQVGFLFSSVVTYGGTPIGTATGGGAGTDLIVTFNSAATTPAVQALIRNLSYFNGSDDPTFTRTLSITLSDSAGDADHDFLSIHVQSNLDPPVITSAGTGGFAENGTGIVFQPTATNPDNGPISWFMYGGDSDLFVINGQTGAVSFKAPPDFEHPLDADHDGVYEMVLVVTNGLFDQTPVTVKVTDVNEAPVITSAAAVNFAENGVGIAYQAVAQDPEGTSATWSISGADAALFELNANTGAVSFKTPPNFEAPQDAGGNNVYNITLAASDGSLSDSKDVAITVTNVNEAPVLTSPAAVSFAENGTGVVYQATASDEDGPTAFTYKIQGPDASLFQIDSATGDVTFVSSPNYERPRDGGFDNTYNIIITATGGGLTGLKPVAITVTDVPTDGTLSGLASDVTFLENTVNAAPQLFESGATYAADDAPTGGSLVVSGLLPEDRVWLQSQGPVGIVGSLVYYQGINIGTVTGGAGTPLTVSFNPVTGAVAAASAITPEKVTALIQSLTYANVSDTPTASRTLSLDVLDKAGTHVNGSPTGVAIAVHVTAEADPANFTSPGTASFAENGTGIAYQASATSDGGPITWSIGGADGALFDIGADTGAVTFKQPPDYDAPADTGLDNNYDITVIATAGGVSSGKPVTISVTNVNEAPTIADWGIVNGPVRIGTTLSENDVNAQPERFATVTFNDPEGNFDGGTMTVSGLLTEDRISILDGGVSIEPGSFGLPIVVQIGFDGTTVTANGTTIGTASGGTGNDFVVTFNAAASSIFVDAVIEQLAYSTASDSPTKFRTLTLDVVDGGGLHANAPDAPPSLLLTVLPQEDPSVITSAATATFAENATGVVYHGTAVDPDGYATKHTWSISGTDAALFNIDPVTGDVTFKTSPDFEAPQDAGGNNVYDIVLTATPDQDQTAGSKAVAITVTNVAEQPTLTGLSPSFSVSEDDARSAPQLFATGAVFHAGDDIFDGAKLTVSGLLAEDRVFVLNEGNGPGQIGFDGSHVSYGGTVIGSVSGGIGDTLTVTLNGAASEAAVQELIQRLAFADPSADPTLNRDLVIDLVDANGVHVNAISVPGVGPQPMLFDAGSFATHPYFVGNPFAGFDAGYNSSPTFVDLNGDRRLDLVAGSTNSSGDGILSAWLNTTAGFVPLTGADNPFGGVLVSDAGRPAPAFVDLDGDGKLDLVVGNTDGTIRAWHNTGSGYTELTGNANPFNFIQPTSTFEDYATPAFTDLDGDGKLDLVVGQHFPGILRSYHNNGDGTYTQLTGADDPFAGISVPTQSAPAFVDLNGDGKLDLVLGSENRWLQAWLNTGSGYVALAGDADPFAGSQPSGGPGGGEGLFSRPAFADLDGDGRVDVVSGNMDGTFSVVRNIERPTDILLTVTHDNHAPTGGVSLAVGGDGVTLSATNTIADADGVGAITYQWQTFDAGTSSWSDLPGVTGPLVLGTTYGQTLRVVAHYTDGFGTAETVASSRVVVLGGPGPDNLHGSAGDDVLAGLGSLDILKGGAGDDWYVVNDTGATIKEADNAGNDTVFSSVSLTLRPNVENLILTSTGNIDGTGNTLDNILTGNSGDNALLGGAGSDTLYGGAGNDVLQGGAGADQLFGGAGDDILRGGAGDDWLIGGDGHDKLFGGDGSDTFVLDAPDASNSDTIADFTSGDDHIAVYAADYGLSTGSLDSSMLANGPRATAHHAQFIFNDANHTLKFDADGIGGSAPVLVAKFSSDVDLQADDFKII